MAKEKQYDLSTGEGFMEAFSTFTELKNKSALIEIKEVKRTRTNQQNSALHLYFTKLAEALNNHGLYFHYTNYKGEQVEILWNMELIKEFIWKPLMKVITDKTSTTELTTNEIDPIYETINNHYSKKGIELFFPSRFGWFLENVK